MTSRSAPVQLEPYTAATWGLFAAWTKSAADIYARAHAIEPKFVLTSSELVSLGAGGLRQLIRQNGVEVLGVHTRAWRRQLSPQVFTAALAVAPVRHRMILDEELGSATSFGSLDAAATAASIPADALGGVVGSVRELAHHAVSSRRAPSPPAFVTRAGAPGSRWVLVIWRSHDAVVGGSITHATGVLKGLRQTGFRIALLTTSEPVPDEVLASVDAVKRAPPLPSRYRLTTDIERLAINRQMRTRGIQWCRRVKPEFIYQRHSLLLDAGADISAVCGVPLVLEWNASEVWALDNWGAASAVGRALAPISRPARQSMERRSVTSAALVLAVSRHAAQMARDAGAPASRVVLLPNGVDLDDVKPAESREGDGPPKVGWIGSFGSWHGAPVIVEAMAHLPLDVRLLMIGDGTEREACQALAESLGIEHRIEWAGTLPHTLALDRLGECDVLVSPHVSLPNTPFFGSPTKIYEYMALAKPIVASRLEQLEEVLEDGRTARLVAPGDVKALADAIKEILDAPDRGRHLGIEARREAEAKHSWHRRVQTLLDHIETQLQDASA